MTRHQDTDSKTRILQAAERLFAERGFDATSVDEIARTAQVNKALIYYYYRDKGDLILSLFTGILEELDAQSESSAQASAPEDPGALKREIAGEVGFLAGRKRILSLMLAEALRSGAWEDVLFRCAQSAFRRGHGAGVAAIAPARRKRDQAVLVHDFFTGFIPLLAFVTLGDKWCEYFGANAATMQQDFVDAFAETHLASQSAHRREGESHETLRHRGNRSAGRKHRPGIAGRRP